MLLVYFSSFVLPHHTITVLRSSPKCVIWSMEVEILVFPVGGNFNHLNNGNSPYKFPVLTLYCYYSGSYEFDL